MDKEQNSYMEFSEGFVDVTLSRGMDVDGAKVKAVRMREPTVADQVAMEKGRGTDAEKEIALVANLCMVTPDDISKLPLRDYKRLQAAYVSFLD